MSTDWSRFGPIAALLSNPQVTEIMVMGAREIYVEVDGKLILTPVSFESEEALMEMIRYIVESVGRRIDAENPVAGGGDAVDLQLRPGAVGAWRAGQHQQVQLGRLRGGQGGCSGPSWGDGHGSGVPILVAERRQDRSSGPRRDALDRRGGRGRSSGGVPRSG